MIYRDSDSPDLNLWSSLKMNKIEENSSYKIPSKEIQIGALPEEYKCRSKSGDESAVGSY